MKISPLDIRKQEFSKQVRGYDVEEVASFLEMVADEYELILNQIKELDKEVELYKGKTSEFQQQETSLHDSMRDVQQIHRQKSEMAEEEAELVLQNAHAEAEQIIQEARLKRQNLLNDINRLEGQRRGFLIRMHHILKSQLDLIEVIEAESPADEPAPVPKPSHRLRSAGSGKAAATEPETAKQAARVQPVSQETGTQAVGSPVQRTVRSDKPAAAGVQGARRPKVTTVRRKTEEDR